MSLSKINDAITFSYTGGVQTFTALYSGVYKLEVWGAQGGGSMVNGSKNDSGAYGGYSYGNVELKKGQTIYICVGGKGTTGYKGTAAGGYNGGGSGSWDNADDEGSGGGGGATHIAQVTGTLAAIGESNKNKVYIVAGGGGGRSFTYGSGTGGGTNGGTTSYTSTSYPTQTSGYAFGQGQNGSGTADSDGVGGGGGGWYGGYANSVSKKSSGTGGSGYIGGVTSGATSNGVRAGNGEAKITFVESYYDLYIGNTIVKNLFLGTKNISNVYLNGLKLKGE